MEELVDVCDPVVPSGTRGGLYPPPPPPPPYFSWGLLGTRCHKGKSSLTELKPLQIDFLEGHHGR